MAQRDVGSTLSPSITSAGKLSLTFLSSYVNITYRIMVVCDLFNQMFGNDFSVHTYTSDNGTQVSDEDLSRLRAEYDHNYR